MTSIDYRILRTEPGDALWHHIASHSPQHMQYIADPNDPGDYHCLVAIDHDDAFRGLCIIDLGPMRLGSLADQIVGFLENILVPELFRRQGVGSALLRAAMELAWQTGAAHVRWTVDYENTAGISFYRSNGAVFIPEEDPQAEEPEKYYMVVVVNPRLRLGEGKTDGSP